MKKLIAASLAAALALGSAGAAMAGAIETSVDASTLPKKKITPLGLYLTPADAHKAIQADPGIVFIDVRDPIEISYVGHAEGTDAIVPLRIATDYAVVPGTMFESHSDPRGADVIAADQLVVGKVADAWVDRAESLIRYLEIALNSGEKVLLPMTLAKIDLFGMKHRVTVKSILGSQFAGVPKTKTPDQITLLEEDKIQAYYTGGHLHATPERPEPLL